MSGRFVRASKYRHVFGRSTKKEQCYDNLRISKNAWDSNIIKANPQYLSVNWEAGGGGAFAVIPLNERGKLPEIIPLFRGHTAAVLDTDWNPFHDDVIVSGSDDGKVFVWKVPENFSLYSDAEEPPDVSPVAKLTGHTRKVGHVLFSPAAENVLASSSGDYTIKLWDVEAGTPKLTLKHPDIVQSLSFSANGSQLVTTSRDKKLRIWDVRQEKPVHEGAAHHGAKSQRAVWMGENDRIATTGFSKMSDRQLGLWDLRAAREPLNGFEILDSISGICMPFWDDGTQCLYLAGKGDGNIRYFEYENDKFEFLSEYKSTDPQRGVALMPKRGINLHENEVVRAYKTVGDTCIEPIPFIVPRRAEVFQGDIYPPTTGLKAAVTATEFFEGKDGIPPKISLESLYEGKEPVEVPADAVPKPAAAAPAPAPVPKPAAEEPAPAAARSPPPSVNDNKASMASMADKFVDKDEPEPEEAPFEDIPKPVERPSVTARMEEKTRGPEISTEPEPAVVAQRAAKAAESESASPSVGAAASAASGIRDTLADIKQMLERQNETITNQTSQIAHLTAELDSLKGEVAELKSQQSDSGKDEKIRMLELELEEARS